MNQQEKKAKGVVDMVFLVDVTGSMQCCIDALKNNIAQFIDSLTSRDANNSSPVKDWRAKVVGFRDFTDSGSEPFIDNAFVTSPEELKSQLSKLQADGGGDEPESALDAIYRVAIMEQTAKDAQAEPNKWRYRSSAARVVILFTDASCHETMSLPEARGGTFDDVFNVVQSNRIILNIFAPDMECYNKLAEVDKSEYEAIPYDSSDPHGAQAALEKYTSDQKNFRRVMDQLAKSVSKSAETPAL
ncbi:MAG TPA: vWA domain-containing protein [Pirellulales bacterium]|nr:vWA domain-containing protein [Pirellulales bacterium]